MAIGKTRAIGDRLEAIGDREDKGNRLGARGK